MGLCLDADREVTELLHCKMPSSLPMQCRELDSVGPNFVFWRASRAIVFGKFGQDCRSLGCKHRHFVLWVVHPCLSELPRYGRYSVTFNESETGALGQVYPAWWLRNPEVGGFPTVELCKLQLHGEVIKAYGGSQFYLARDEHAQQSCQL